MDCSPPGSSVCGIFQARVLEWGAIDSDCIREIKMFLLLIRKTMTNLDSILKSRDITLLTKVYIVKAWMDVRVEL